MRFLIVNADDFNLTRDVSRAILIANEKGIVSSTSIFANLSLTPSEIRVLKTRKNLGVGLHLNSTFGKPLSKSRSVVSLLDSSGFFKRANAYHRNLFRSGELEREYTAQIDWFRSAFGKLPDHLNTHHHIHALPHVFHVVAKLSLRYQIPMRRVQTFVHTITNFKIRSSDYFFGNLSPQKYWSEENLYSILQNLPEGTSEIMCHPGFVDRELKKKSSFTTGRQYEFDLFSKSFLKSFLKQEGIELIPRLP